MTGKFNSKAARRHRSNSNHNNRNNNNNRSNNYAGDKLEISIGSIAIDKKRTLAKCCLTCREESVERGSRGSRGPRERERVGDRGIQRGRKAANSAERVSCPRNCV